MMLPRGAWLCRMPLGQLPSTDGETVLSLGGIFLQHAPATALKDHETVACTSEETRDADEAHVQILKMSTGRSQARMLQHLHHFINTKHAAWFGPLWRASTTPDVLRRTCTRAGGSAVWKVLLLHADAIDSVPLLSSCFADVPGWMQDEHASQFLICAILYAHPAAAHALARSACRSLLDGAVDTNLACVRSVVVALAQTGFPMLAQVFRTSSIDTVTPLLLAPESDMLLSALAEISQSKELLEFLQLWHPAVRYRSMASF